MKIYSWNVNGIRAVIKKGTFQQFFIDHQPDIVCLQETKAMQGQAEIDMPDYTELWNSADRKGYSGTAIFTKEKPLSFANGIPEIIAKPGDLADSYGDPNSEGRVLTAEFEKFYIVTVYTPNAKDDLSRVDLRYTKWDPAFLAYCQGLREGNFGAAKPVIFCGDLNVAHKEIDLANPKPNEGKHGFTKEEREGFENILKAGFIDSFRHFYPDKTEAYTWWTAWANARARNVGWRIDYFMVSEELKDGLKDAKIHADVMGSDHCPVSIELAL
jgi:exodeoxyribonuclease-3